MTPEELEIYNTNYVESVRTILRSLFSTSEGRIKQKILELYNIVSEGNLIRVYDFRQRLREIQFIYAEMEDLFNELVNQKMMIQLIEQYNKGVDLAYTALIDSNIPIEIRASIDPKSLNILVKDMIADFTLATEGTRRLIGSFYNFSKQGIVTESEITFAVAQSMIESGYRTDAVRGIKRLLDSAKLKGTSAYVDPKKAQELTNRAVQRYIRDQAKKGKVVRQSDITKYFNKVQKDGFIRIINKNGDEMFFRTSVYSSYVANTRLADSQVKGAIEQGLAAGISLFQITSHNSPNFCGEFERTLVSSDPNLIGVRYMHPGSSTNYVPNSKGWQKILRMDRSNIPTYHINCKHRIYPIVITSTTIKQYQMQLTERQREAIAA